MIDQLIRTFSPLGLQAYFRSRISAFRPVNEDFNHLLSSGGGAGFLNIQKLGEVSFPDSDELLVFTCRIDGELSERSSKKRQFELARKVLTEEFKDGALFAFHDDSGCFRLSFIRKHYGEQDRKYSSWKRYTYFIDPKAPNRTFIERIERCGFGSLEDIQAAFSVEPLNKEFYTQIVRAFYALVGGEIGSGRRREVLKPVLKLPGRKHDRTLVRQFGVRLIGRIVFCWFLKHKRSKAGKPLIPDDWLSSGGVTEDYYHSVLEPLFFEILNKPHDIRHKRLPEGHEMIPFLNGGLFEPHSGDDEGRGDSDYYIAGARSVGSRPSYELKIADDWFANLFEVLERYNFTIDENSISDAEVSIDPEMLGRIFENLLAEIDPNLEEDEAVSVRRATGSYYTPREIVDYMVEEALVKYLHNRTGLPERFLHLLFGDKEELPFTIAQQVELLDALDAVKILDPAAGSGAFPMGCLHKIVTALQKIDPEADLWRARQLDKLTNAAVRAEMKHILEKSNAEYARKLGVLQQCIYGADIQPIAAEISRLRGFLSLIVDEEINDHKANRGVIALPNLEFKFVTANTLISLENTGLFGTNMVNEALPELQEIRQDYLQCHGDEKERLRKRFARIQREIYKDQLQFDPELRSRAMKLATWDPFGHAVTNWFDPEWMFGIKQFDIVIGNPPYGGTKIDESLKRQLEIGSRDPYGAFLARYLRQPGSLTPLRHGGILAFIVSDTFMTIRTHKPLRELMLANRVHSMIRVHPDTFKATVNTAIVLCERQEVLSREDYRVLMADFTNTSIHDRYDRFVQLLDKVVNYSPPEIKGESMLSEGVLYTRSETYSTESSAEYAVYTYPQSLIRTNGNLPFFVGSPKLFAFMDDRPGGSKDVVVGETHVRGKNILMNGQPVDVVRLGDIAEVKQGLATGDNEAYLFKAPGARGSYREITDFQKYVLTDTDLARIRRDESVRRDVAFIGISTDDLGSSRYFEGRYIVPHDKGGESDAESGWLPNYFVKTGYYIDWSEAAVHRMKTVCNDNGRPKSRFQNVDWYFVFGIDYSQTGVYSPSFRLNSGAVFNTEATSIFSSCSKLFLLGILVSKITKYFIKNYIDQTVHSSADKLKDTVITTSQIEDLVALVNSIINNQMLDARYPYFAYEQISVDLIVYNSFRLSEVDIIEVEHWYERRYPRLIESQRRSLAAMGLSTDFVTLYRGLVEQHRENI